MVSLIIWIAGLVLLVILCRKAFKKDELLGGFLAVITVIGLFLSLMAICCTPSGGFTEWKVVHEIQLAKKDAIGSTIEEAKAFLDYYEISNSKHEKNNIIYTSKEDINFFDLCEDSTITIPTLQLYKREGGKNLWTFTKNEDQYKYMIKVPADTINLGDSEFIYERE